MLSKQRSGENSFTVQICLKAKTGKYERYKMRDRENRNVSSVRCEIFVAHYA